MKFFISSIFLLFNFCIIHSQGFDLYGREYKFGTELNLADSIWQYGFNESNEKYKEISDYYDVDSHRVVMGIFFENKLVLLDIRIPMPMSDSQNVLFKRVLKLFEGNKSYKSGAEKGSEYFASYFKTEEFYIRIGTRKESVRCTIIPIKLLEYIRTKYNDYLTEVF